MAQEVFVNNSDKADDIRLSAFQADAGALRVSGFQGDAANFRISAVEAPVGAVRYQNVTGASSINVKSGSGILKSVIFNTSSTSRVVLYDNTTHSGTVIATIDGVPTKLTQLNFYANFNTGLTVSAVSSPGDMTVTWI